MSLRVHLRTCSARGLDGAQRVPAALAETAPPAPCDPTAPSTPSTPSTPCVKQRRHRAASAQGLVEFAIVGPVFFMMLFGMLDLGRAVWTSHELANGTREGSRYVMVNGTADTWDGTGPVTTRVLDSTSALQSSNLTVTVTGAPGIIGGFATVNTTYRFNFIVTQIIGRGTINMTQRSRIVIQS